MCDLIESFILLLGAHVGSDKDFSLSVFSLTPVSRQTKASFRLNCLANRFQDLVTLLQGCFICRNESDKK